jgi:hypothetical protein
VELTLPSQLNRDVSGLIKDKMLNKILLIYLIVTLVLSLSCVNSSNTDQHLQPNDLLIFKLSKYLKLNKKYIKIANLKQFDSTNNYYFIASLNIKKDLYNNKIEKDLPLIYLHDSFYVYNVDNFVKAVNSIYGPFTQKKDQIHALFLCNPYLKVLDSVNEIDCYNYDASEIIKQIDSNSILIGPHNYYYNKLPKEIEPQIHGIYWGTIGDKVIVSGFEYSKENGIVEKYEIIIKKDGYIETNKCSLIAEYIGCYSRRID